MAGNEWIHGYLEAILDGDAKEDQRSSPHTRERGQFTPTSYFVDVVVSGTDEAALHRTWMMATATKNAQERSSRLENLCWRIWHISRKKKQMEWEGAQRLAKRRLDLEQRRMYVTEEMSEDLSEAEKPDTGDASAHSDGEVTIKFSETLTDSHHELADQDKEKRLYIVMISLHGLVRGENMELGRDSDTGGQVKYVVEFARALANLPEVYRVDLLTRQISAPDVDWSYGEPTEMLTAGLYDSGQEVGQSAGAYIVRIPCGPRDKYLQKELLWPYIQEFVDGALNHILNMAKVLGEQIGRGQQVWPYVIHGHYADAGNISSLLSGSLNVPMVLTGHSLGRNKLEQLLKQGRQSKEKINSTYKIMRRIEAEELSLDAAELVITSTKQEIEQQWGLYYGFDVKIQRTLRLRAKRGFKCYGRYMPTMTVIPPGMDFSNVVVQDVGDVLEDVESVTSTSSDGNAVISTSKPDPSAWADILHFFTNPAKPMILALARPDPKKNIPILVKAFGECRPLRKLANLTLIMGNRDNIDEMSSGNANVLTTVLKLIDKYDLYGEVAYPKHHKQSEVPDIYRFAAKTKGVFINPALVEPFGLTLIEAAAHGLPMVATTNGGPVDIHRALNNGLLVDPHDDKAIADALFKLVSDKNLWTNCQRNGLKNIHRYSWPEHCRVYLSHVAVCRKRHPQWQSDDLDGNDDLDSFGDSLRDVHDTSLRLSIDGEKSGGGSLNGPADLDKILENGLVQNGREGLAEHLRQLVDKSKSEPTQENNHRTKPERSNSLSTSKAGILRKRKWLYVIAVDCYGQAGEPIEEQAKIVKEVFRAVRDESGNRSAGFIFSTSLTVSETMFFLRSNGIKASEFDALICSSGSELYYPTGLNGCNETGNEIEHQLCVDLDYETHIDYRWGEEGLIKTMHKITNVDETSEKYAIVSLDKKRSNPHCLTYLVKDPLNVPTTEEFRQQLRGRGLRCHVIYCQNSTRLHIVPLHASRAQALRYLFVRWGVDVANMTVFIGETGDTDYEDLIPGLHRTVILKAAVKVGSQKLLHNGQTCQQKDVPSDSPYIVTTEDGFDSQQITVALKRFG